VNHNYKTDDLRVKKLEVSLFDLEMSANLKSSVKIFGFQNYISS
jgi:hypothetical protein